MMAAGKKASSDGSVLVARSCDLTGGGEVVQVLAVPRRSHEKGEEIRMTASAPPAVKESNGMVAILCAPPSCANICTRLRATVTMVINTNAHFAIGLP